MEKNQLWQGLSGLKKLRMRTDGGANSFWRDLLAFDPCSSFILDDIDELAELVEFLDVHKDKLCAGYFSYDLGMDLHGVSSRHQRSLPLAVMHAYDKWVEYPGGSPNYVGMNEGDLARELKQNWQPEIDPVASLQFTPALSASNYKKSISVIQDYIRAGDVYQLNFTQHLKATSEVPISYAALLGNHPAACAMALETEELQIHSLSPELFLHYADGILTTEPIKGTRPRGKTRQEDDALKQALMGSEKEQAELFMITDLLRNDLGKVSEIGSISLEAVKDIRKLPRVWHTCSRISGRLRADLKPVSALLSMLPGGSITGCPKKHAMELIDELETASRGIYTGCMGYFHPAGDFSFNIAIRTLIQKDHTLSLGSGGGITIDSHWKDEWQELLVKASTFQ